MNTFRRHRRDLVHWAVTIVLSVLIGLMIVQVIDLAREHHETERLLEEARQRSADRARSIEDLTVVVLTLRSQVEELGEIPRGPDLESLRGPQGEPGPPPTQGQVQAAVSAYLTRNPPEPGRAPTDAEVAAAVAAFCADDRCVGSTGPAGVDGEDGADGQDGIDGADGRDGVDGERGPGPTADQVAAAVAAYCDANNQCRGPAGADGQPPWSWTFTAQGNRTYTCVRTDPFDPAMPTYRCTSDRQEE